MSELSQPSIVVGGDGLTGELLARLTESEIRLRHIVGGINDLALRVGLTPHAGAVGTLPPEAGSYFLTTGTQAGQVWTRDKAGAAAYRNAALEAAPLFVGTRAERKAKGFVTAVQWAETDTGMTVTFIPGLGWRGPYGDNVDNPPPPPPPDTGAY